MTHLITIPPRLDMETAVKFHRDWQELTANCSEITIECNHLQQLSTAGIQLLISLKKSMEAAGKKFIIRNLSEDIKNDFKVMGILKYLA